MQSTHPPLPNAVNTPNTENVISLTVQQEGHHIHAGNAQDNLQLEGTVAATQYHLTYRESRM